MACGRPRFGGSDSWRVGALLLVVVLVLVLVLGAGAARPAAGQCLRGDCQSGTGRQDLGYATYEGHFQNGQPEGEGTMDYGGGDRYVGQWHRGREHGAGQLYKKGVATAVTYSNGVLQARAAPPVVAGNPAVGQEKVPGCQQGDCVNGYGVLVSAGGNKYEGQFRYGNFEGPGRATFVGGDVCTARFAVGIPQEGSLYYAAQSITFQGTFNPNYSPKTGTYVSTHTDNIVSVQDGAVSEVRNPVREASAAKQAEHDRLWQTCAACKGQGGEAVADYYNTSTTSALWGSRAEGYMTYEVETKRNYTGTTHPVPCGRCGGKGEVRRR